jgi:hypothetical protein
MDNDEWNPNMEDIQEGDYPKKKEECCWLVLNGQVYVRNVLLDAKTKQGNLRVDKYWVYFYFF